MQSTPESGFPAGVAENPSEVDGDWVVISQDIPIRLKKF
jgi:hypothetical protein